MGWKIINIAINESLKIYLNNLLIQSKNNKIIIPLVDIDTLIIESYVATYSNKLLETLMKYNISVICCDYQHIPFMYLVPINGHHNSLKILESQIKWSSKYKNNLWTKIVKNKIYNQEKNLFHLKIEHNEDEFSSYINEIKNMDISNREGHAAKSYWKNLFGIDFIRDVDQGVFPKINSLLNYGYTILRGMVIRTIVKKGLDARISIFHKSFNNFFALASDLMEPFRPLVDYCVYLQIQQENTWIDSKENLLNFLANAEIFINDKKYYLNVGIDIYIGNVQKGLVVDWIELWK